MPASTVKVPVEVIVPPVIPFPVTTLVTPELELVPAPIRFLTSVAVIPLFKVGEEPLLSIAGVPVSFTTPKLVLAPEAELEPVPPFATERSVPDQSELLIESVPPKVIVPVDVMVPPVSVKPFTDPDVATLVTPEELDVPAPINERTSLADIPLAKDGVDPFVVIAGKGPS